jgi:CyaY protein
LILSRQEPLRQLWLAARSGGYHFDYNEEDGQWECEKTDERLNEVLARATFEQAGLELDLEEL